METKKITSLEGTIIGFMIASTAIGSMFCLIYGALVGAAFAAMHNISYYAKDIGEGAAALIIILGVLQLAWKIPMTIYTYKTIKNGKTFSTAFKVCTLIFVSIISGVLLLCRDEIKLSK